LCTVRVFVEIESRATDIALSIDNRVANILFVSVAFWENHCRSEIDRHSPEFAQQFALNLNALYPISLFRRILRRYHVIKQDAYFVARSRVEANFLNIAVKIAGRNVEEAPGHIPMHPDGAAIAARALRVYVHNRLNVIVACGQLRETLDRMAECGMIDSHRLTGLKAVGVNTEDWHRVWRYLEARLGAI